jgi:hypothetical protein
MSTPQRASKARDAFTRAFTPPKAPEHVTPAENEPEAAPEDRLSVFTVRLNGNDAEQFDRLALDLRRQLGRAVRKSDLVRVLVALAADDATLRQQLTDELRSRQS